MPLSQAQLDALGLTEDEKKTFGAGVGNAAPAASNVNETYDLFRDGGMPSEERLPVIEQEARARMLDLDEEPIKRQPEQRVFDGSSYKPQPSDWQRRQAAVGERFGIVSDLPPESNVQDNEELYQATGEPGPMGTRIQRDVDPETGEKSTYFVPRPEENVVDRTLGGGAVKAIKGTVSAAEYVADTFPPLVMAQKLGAALLNSPDDPTLTNWTNENFPTIPAQNDVERTAQEITSVVIGAVTGGGGAKKGIETIQGANKAIAEMARRLTPEMMKKSPKNWQQKIATVIKAAVIETGANVGGTITTPSDTEPFLLKGETDEQNRWNLFLENMGLSGLVSAGIKGAKEGAKKVGGLILQGQRADSAKALGEMVIKYADPYLKGTSPEEFARRADIFSKTLKANSQGDVGQFGTVDRAPPEAMVIGARQYVEQAYDFLRPEMGQGEWEAFVNSRAKDIGNRLQQFRHDNLKSAIVQSADSITNDKVAGVLKRSAASLGSVADTEKAGMSIGQRQLAAFNKLDTDVTDATRKKVIAEGNMKAAQDQTAVLDSLQRNKQWNPLGSNENTNQARNTLASKFEAGAVNAKNKVDAKFDDIAAGHDWDKEKFAKILVRAGNTSDDVAKNLGLTDIAPKLIRSQTGDPVEDYVNMMDYLDGVSLATLFKEVRPRISQALNSPFQLGQEGQREALMKAKQWIDTETARYAEETGDTQFQDALAAHADRKKVFEPVQQMRDVSKDAIRSSKSRGVAVTPEDLRMKSRQMIDSALSGQDQSGTLLNSVAKALEQSGATREEIVRPVVDMFMTSVSRGKADHYITAEQLESAIAPYVDTIRQLSPDLYDDYLKAHEVLKSAKAGFDDATREVDARILQRATEGGKLESEAATKLLLRQGDKYADVTGDPQKVFNRIFNDVDETQSLVSKANPEELKSLKAQWLRKTLEEFKVSPNLSVSAEGETKFVSEMSRTKVGTYLSEANGTKRKVLETLFADDPVFVEDFMNLVTELELSLGTRNVAPNTFNSRTVVSNERQKAMSILITATLGVLNPVATKARAFSGAATRAMQRGDQELVDTVIPSLLVSSDYLSKTIDQIVADNSKAKSIAQQLASASMSNPIVKGGVASARPETEREPKGVAGQTNKAFGINK